MSRSISPASVLALMLGAVACTGDEPNASDRGSGRPVASLSPERAAAAYTSGMRGMFDLGPGLVLLLNPVRLPRSRSAEGADSLPDDIVGALRRLGSIQGFCEPRRGDDARHAPICDHPSAGYIIRVSDIFQGQGDTVRLYVTAERYRPSADTSGFQPPLRLEQRYELTPRGEAWAVARKSRMVR